MLVISCVLFNKIFILSFKTYHSILLLAQLLHPTCFERGFSARSINYHIAETWSTYDSIAQQQQQCMLHQIRPYQRAQFTTWNSYQQHNLLMQTTRQFWLPLLSMISLSRFSAHQNFPDHPSIESEWSSMMKKINSSFSSPYSCNTFYSHCLCFHLVNSSKDTLIWK